MNQQLQRGSVAWRIRHDPRFETSVESPDCVFNKWLLSIYLNGKPACKLLQRDPLCIPTHVPACWRNMLGLQLRVSQ